MRKYFFLGFVAMSILPALATADLFINEIDYDNPSTDNFEWIELAGTAGVNLDAYQLVFYNGFNATVYATYDLPNFTFTAETNGWGFFVVGLVASSFGVSPDFTPAGWTTNVIQNGAPDAIQLLLTMPSSNIHFLEYEGNNPAIPDDQNTSLADSDGVGRTLYLTGTGNGFSDFTFANFGVGGTGGTPGALNTGQTLTAIPEASAILFAGLIAGAFGVSYIGRRIYGILK